MGADAPPTGRVVAIHRQTRAYLAWAAPFAVASVVATVVPHRTGVWLPLHLFLAGALVLAISGATQLFTVTWSGGSPIHPALVRAQRVVVAVGAAGLAVARELRRPSVLAALAGLCITAGLVLLGYLLVAEVRAGRVKRFHAAVRFYVAAAVAGVAGTILGAAMAGGDVSARDAHLTLNLLGLTGLVIAGTLPFFTATQARMKMSRRATPRRATGALAWMVAALAVAAGGSAVDRDAVTGAGLLTYAGGLVFLVTLLPVPGRKQLRWAGPRLVALGIGVAWWAGAVAVAGARVLDGSSPFPTAVVLSLVVGGYVQILLASVAYLAPVLRGGGHVVLAAGFRATRSWAAVLFVNAAAVAFAASAQRAGVVALLTTVAAAATCAVRFVASGRDREASPPFRRAGG